MGEVDVETVGEGINNSRMIHENYVLSPPTPSGFKYRRSPIERSLPSVCYVLFVSFIHLMCHTVFMSRPSIYSLPSLT